MTWENFYNVLGIRDFIYFISSPEIQDALFPIKMIFLLFAVLFLILVVYFMVNSSWLQYKFLEDVTEFFSWQAFGQREMEKQWNRIKRRVESGTEADYKLSIIDADDFLAEVLDNRGYEGANFEESIQKAGKLIEPILQDVLHAHEVRNHIVYNPDFKLTAEEAKNVLSAFETAVKSIGLG